MLRWVILAVVVILLAAGSTVFMNATTTTTSPFKLTVAPEKKGPSPRAEIDKELTWEFGELGQQVTQNRIWKLTNKGEVDLEIWKGASTCMCTVAKLDKDGDKLTLKPGESTDINIEFKTNFVTGDFHKGAHIMTSDPDHPDFPLFVHGKINPPVIVVPDQTIDLHTVNTDDPKDGVYVILYSPDRPETQITQVNTSKPDYFKTEVVPLNEQELAQGKVKAGHKININVLPGFPIGLMREEVVIHTDHPLRPEVKLLVTGTVAGPISVVPDRVRNVSVKSNAGASSEATLIVRGGDAANFTVASKPDHVDVAIEPTDAKGRYRMKVTIPPGAPTGLIDGEVVLKTDHPGVGELKVPVYFLVRVN